MLLFSTFAIIIDNSSMVPVVFSSKLYNLKG